MADVVADATATFESPVVARTKLVPPRLRAATIDRPELVARRLASPARLGMIAGPAGAGKSTLLAQCYASDPSPVWLSLGSMDNDPSVLWTSIIENTSRTIEGFGDRYRARLSVVSPGAIDEIVVSICNELADRAAQIHVFLDDVHAVHNVVSRQSRHQFVSTLPIESFAQVT